MCDESELRNLPSYKLQNRIPQKPEYLFFFGAGASFGSDSNHLARQDKLPPLGRNLFPALHKDPTLKHWNMLPKEFGSLFNK